jgi:flagellar FliJ protein
MKRSQRLDRISELGRNEERDAGSRLAAARQAHDGRQQLLEQLMSYRSEYRELFLKQCNAGMDALRYRNFQQFFDQLDRAIGEQQRNIQAGEQQVEQHRAAWLQKHQATEILAKLQEKLQGQEQREEQKQEQKQADETFSRHRPTS